MSRILIIEDNRDYAATLASNLAHEGHEMDVAGSGVGGLERAAVVSPDLVILDLMLPGMNGFTVLQRLRAAGHHVPVLIMSALGTEDEKVRAFSLGADDYVVKPCGLREILARVRALLKRAPANAGIGQPTVVRIGDLAIDTGAREVRRGNTVLALRPREFDLLAALVRHRGRVVSQATLLSEVWGYAPGTESRTVETHLAALRQRLDDDPRSPRYIRTVRGAGYCLGGDPGND